METIVLNHKGKKNLIHRYIFRTDEHPEIDQEIANWTVGELSCNCGRSQFIKDFFNKKFRKVECDTDNPIVVEKIFFDDEEVYSEIETV